jgi:hypothetical protein
MEIIAMIMSGLALLAASVCLVLTVRAEKRSKKRKTALIQYVDQECKAVSSAAAKYVQEELEPVADEVEKLKNGIIPNYEQAKAAANAVNDFNKGISNILGFDPMEAVRAERQKERMGDEE